MDLPDASSRGSRPALIENFRIEGLYGYRTISLQSSYAATILIAKNGSGKTTLLAALDAFLKGEFSRLIDVRFLRICCKLRGLDDELVLTRNDLEQYVTIKPGSRIDAQARRLDIEPAALFGFVEKGLPDVIDFDDDIISKIARRHSYSRADIQGVINELRSALEESAPNIFSLMAQVKHALDGREVVYLATYRRIEMSIDTPKERYARDKRGLFRKRGACKQATYNSVLLISQSDSRN